MDWLILHGGALGDLALTIQLALGLEEVRRARSLHLVSRVDPGDLSACTPSITRQSPEGIELHWLYSDHDGEAPHTLRQLVCGRRVLSALGDANSIVHERLVRLEPRRLLSFDPRPRPGLQTHITRQWQRDLERQGVLFPKCIHQKGGNRRLAFPGKWAASGRAGLAEIGCREPTVLVHPGSGGVDKCWPLTNFIEVARTVETRGGAACFLIGPAEIERWPAARVDKIRQNYQVLESPSADALLRVLAAAVVLICNDSGPAHLAALLNRPTVAVFGPTAGAVWHPLSPGSEYIQGRPQESTANWQIEPGRVAEAAQRFVSVRVYG